MLSKTMIGGIALAAAPATLGENYPNKPVKLVLSFAARGMTNIIAQVVASKITPYIKSGWLAQVAIMARKRLKGLPDVPTPKRARLSW